MFYIFRVNFKVYTLHVYVNDFTSILYYIAQLYFKLLLLLLLLLFLYTFSNFIFTNVLLHYSLHSSLFETFIRTFQGYYTLFKHQSLYFSLNIFHKFISPPLYIFFLKVYIFQVISKVYTPYFYNIFQNLYTIPSPFNTFIVHSKPLSRHIILTFPNTLF